jgi:hypothetical protein
MTSKSKTAKTASSKPTSMAAEQRAWQARDDLRTIQSAQGIQQDPRRMAAAQKEANSQVKALQQITKK